MNIFAKLYATEYGSQVLFTIDRNSDDETGILVQTTTKDGNRYSVHLGIDQLELDEAFELISQEMADSFAKEYSTKTAFELIKGE